MRNLGTLRRLQGRYGEALEWLEKATAESAVQRSHRGDLAHGLVEAGLTQLELGDVAAGRDRFMRAEALFSDVQKDRVTPARGDLLVGMARVQLHDRDYAAALRSAERADLFWRDFDPDNRSAGDVAFWLCRRHRAPAATVKPRPPSSAHSACSRDLRATERASRAITIAS